MQEAHYLFYYLSIPKPKNISQNIVKVITEQLFSTPSSISSSWWCFSRDFRLFLLDFCVLRPLLLFSKAKSWLFVQQPTPGSLSLVILFGAEVKPRLASCNTGDIEVVLSDAQKTIHGIRAQIVARCKLGKCLFPELIIFNPSLFF